MLVYLDTQEAVLLRSNDKSYHVLFHIIRQRNTSTNIWYSDAVNKKEIISKLEIALPTLNKHIASLKKRGLLKARTHRGEYMLNPNIFQT